MRIRAKGARARRLAAEALERRPLMSAGPLGINVRPEFVDAVKQSASWGQARGGPALSKDAEGWPTTDAELLLMDYRVNMPWNGPDPNAVAPDVSGTYHLSFRGRATVAPPSWNPNFVVANQSYDAAANVTTAEVIVPSGATPLVFMDFTNTINPESATGAGVTDVRMVRPGYDPNTTQVFTTNLLNALEPFGTLRTLDAVDVNAYPITVDFELNQIDWSERRLPSEASQFGDLGGKVGIAWEHVVQLANESDSDLWINVPGPATDDYVRGLAELLAYGNTVDGIAYPPLEAGLKVYVEYSNEVWGGIWNNRLYNIAAAEAEVASGDTAVNNDGNSGPATWGERRYLERTRELADIFREVLGADPGYDKVRPVLGWQAANWSSGGWQYYERTLGWFQETYGEPSQTFHGLGVANYWNPDDYTSVDTVIESLVRNEASAVQSALQMTTMATYFGVKNVAYEGGPGVLGDGNTSEGQNALAALRDPRMADLVYQHYVNWYANGGDLAAFYAGPYGTWGPWYPWSAAEQWQAANPSLSPKYRGLEMVADAAPVPVSVGTAVSPYFSTTFDATADTLGQSFQRPDTGEDGYWLLNAATAGSYPVIFNTIPGSGGGDAAGLVQVYVNNRPAGGPIAISPDGKTSLGRVPLDTGLNTVRLLVLRGENDPSSPGSPLLHAFTPVSLTFAGRLAPRKTLPAVAGLGQAPGAAARTAVEPVVVPAETAPEVKAEATRRVAPPRSFPKFEARAGLRLVVAEAPVRRPFSV